MTTEDDRKKKLAEEFRALADARAQLPEDDSKVIPNPEKYMSPLGTDDTDQG